MVPKQRKANPMLIKSLSATAGRSVFTGKLASAKQALRAEVKMLTRLYSRDGGVIHVCRPAIAYGASFSRNQHPRSTVRGD